MEKKNSIICVVSALQIEWALFKTSDVIICRHKRESDPESSTCALNKYRDWIVQQTGTEVNARNRRVSPVTYINVNQLFFATTYFCDSFLINLCNSLYQNCNRYYTILLKLESLQQQLCIIFNFRVYGVYGLRVFILIQNLCIIYSVFVMSQTVNFHWLVRYFYMYIIMNKYQFSVRNTAASLGQSSDFPIVSVRYDNRGKCRPYPSR